MKNLYIHVWNQLSALQAGLSLVCLSLMCSCSSVKQVTQTPAPTVNTAERSLLEMNFGEAKTISPQNAEVGSLFKVAADSVQVLKADSKGRPVKVLAKGHVFIEAALEQRTTALCEEAVLTRNEITMTGKPMLKRGNRVARATTAETRFWITEARLHVAGPSELAMLDAQPMMPAPSLLASNTQDYFPVPEPMLPPKTDVWVAAAMDNVLLPALPELAQ